MTLQLVDDDRRAVDIVLGNSFGPGAGAASPGFHQRLNQVTRLLDLLRHYPVGEVPNDLRARTLRLVDTARHLRIGQALTQTHAMAAQAPLA
jgi:hypothetical protein